MNWGKTEAAGGKIMEDGKIKVGNGINEGKLRASREINERRKL